MQWRTDALERTGEPRSDAHAQAAALSRAFAEHAAKLFSAEMLDSDPKAFFDQSSQAIGAVATYGNEVQDNLAAALLARANKQTLMSACKARCRSRACCC